MLFLATFFPTWEGGAGVYDFVGVSYSLSCFVNCGTLAFFPFRNMLLTVLQYEDPFLKLEPLSVTSHPEGFTQGVV